MIIKLMTKSSFVISPKVYCLLGRATSLFSILKKHIKNRNKLLKVLWIFFIFYSRQFRPLFQSVLFVSPRYEFNEIAYLRKGITKKQSSEAPTFCNPLNKTIGPEAFCHVHIWNERDFYVGAAFCCLFAIIRQVSTFWSPG